MMMRVFSAGFYYSLLLTASTVVAATNPTAWISSTFTPKSRFLGGSLSSGTGSAGNNKKNEMTMYFDDVSREGAKTLKKDAIILKHLVAIPPPTSESSLAKSSAVAAPPPSASTLIEKKTTATTTTATTTTATTTTTPPKETSTTKIKKISESEINAHDTKEEILLKRLRLGYNAQTARNLSPAEVIEQTEMWATRSGVVAGEISWGDELYDDLLGTTVATTTGDGSSSSSSSPSTTPIAALAAFWKAVVDVIDANRDDEFHSARRWTSSAMMVNENLRQERRPQVHFIAFPYHDELYDYKRFSTLLAAVEFSKDLCVYLGRHMTLTLFHPQFKNAPHLFSPERHSPFPTAGLQFGDRDASAQLLNGGGIRPSAASGAPKRQRGNGKSSTTASKSTMITPSIFPRKPLKDGEEDDDDDDDGDAVVDAIANRRLRDMDDAKSSLEVLFNSAAASGKNDNINSLSDYDSPVSLQDEEEQDNILKQEWQMRQTTETDDTSAAAKTSSSSTASSPVPVVITDEEARKLAWSFAQERQRRRRDLPKARVVNMVEEWVERQREQENAGFPQKKPNPAIRYMDTIFSPRRQSQTTKSDESSRSQAGRLEQQKEELCTVSNHKMGEKIYADIWATISDLYEAGQRADEEEGERQTRQFVESSMNDKQGEGPSSSSSSSAATAEAASSTESTTRFNLYQWMNTLSGHGKGSSSSSFSSTGGPAKANTVGGSAVRRSSSSSSPIIVKSRLFITTKYLAYNAQSFKRFAITINAALKRLTDGRMFLEVFHPEYVGNQGYNHSLRRAPFPMIMICYHVQPRRQRLVQDDDDSDIEGEKVEETTLIANDMLSLMMERSASAAAAAHVDETAIDDGKDDK